MLVYLLPLMSTLSSALIFLCINVWMVALLYRVSEFLTVKKYIYIWHHIKCGTTVAHNNAVLRHFVAKTVFPRGSDRQETTILERNTSFSDRETLEQSCWHSNCPFTVDKLSTHPDRFQNSWQPSRALVSVLRSLVSCILPRLLSILSPRAPYIILLRHFRKATWLDRQHSGGGNENGIGRSPDQFFPVWRKMVWERDYSILYVVRGRAWEERG